MKKNIFCLFFICISNLWAQSLTDFYFMYDSDWYLKGGEKTGIIDSKGNELYAVYDADTGNKIDSMSLFIDENGYVKAIQDNSVSLIMGPNIGFLSEDENSTDYILPNLVKSITSADYMTEKIGGKTVEYKAENLLKSAIWGSHENPYVYNSQNTPFVPKNNGKKGLGTKLTISLKKSKNKILILGGYAKPFGHPDYYHKNCRPKTVKIRDLDSDYSITCEIQDMAVYQSFDFGKPLANIELKITDVYEGSKYSDLCISGILFK